MTKVASRIRSLAGRVFNSSAKDSASSFKPLAHEGFVQPVTNTVLAVSNSVMGCDEQEEVMNNYIE